MNKKSRKSPFFIVLAAAVLFTALLFIVKPEAGRLVGGYFWGSARTMLKILPLTFILISLFEVWVKKERVERHLGAEGGAVSFLWAIILGGTTVGPFIVAFPIAGALFRKGARLSVLFTYLGASAVCRIPMTLFESSYLGVKFTLVRYSVAIPLIILTSILMGRILEKRGFALKEEL